MRPCMWPDHVCDGHLTGILSSSSDNPKRRWSTHLRDAELPCVVSCDAHGALGHAVVAVAQRQHVIVACVQPGHQHGHVVGLAAAVDKVGNLHVLLVVSARLHTSYGSCSASMLAWFVLTLACNTAGSLASASLFRIKPSA